MPNSKKAVGFIPTCGLSEWCPCFPCVCGVSLQVFRLPPTVQGHKYWADWQLQNGLSGEGGWLFVLLYGPAINNLSWMSSAFDPR